mmetsp:Transcript_7987/g.18012  ORF Transcript_7987/g.18012 Transcript_7987/m.18012 type:complete len:1067 (+) Transcript_7987:222-3422(+)|eukprot:CAMPEP_0172315236 /NCGR_PEP_ID=MMETSP1058-20130122/24543_1 /TAXON_ID=83371 /ORGANISM="Detonula confervacea, Strain CCMP 353" /LENGTH=1066 /DNA_ID=CAMNT_0013029281 /DNA_START=211 /DNA_END=3411 /DNA_ORIENTATION=+
MLTTWKHTRTSIEYPLHASNHGEGSAKKKKKKSRKSLAESATPSSTPDVIGAQFVGPFYQEKANPSTGNKKRRKFNNDNTSGATGMDHTEPILCLTSPHRVVFMDKGENDTIAASGNFTESKSRNYVTRPGAGSRFSLGGTVTGHHTTSKDGTTFAGMFPPGAQYDPASNLIYAIRNGGAEVAIWTAAPSSCIPGPDDDAFGDEVSNGINGTNGRKLNPRENARKRKPNQQKGAVHGGSGSSADAVISQRLQIPQGKVAVTLTPFSIPALAEGVAGCCDDGSIWVAIRFQTGQFELLIAEGSSMVEKAAKGKTSAANKKRKSLAKTKSEDKKDGWVLLDSRATGTIDRHDGKTSVLLSIQSAVLPEDKAQVVFRNHQVRIHNEESDKHTAIHLQRSKEQNILQLATSGSDIAAKFDASADSLSIVHRKNEDRWMFTSVDLSRSNGALINSMVSFPLPFEMNGATVFSFGKVSQNVVAMLMKSQSSEQPETSVMSMKVIDFRRKAELSSICWIEGDDTEIEEPRSIFNDVVLNKMLHGKRCHGMITNELDGSIALLTSSKDDKGSLDIVFSKLDMNSTAPQNAPVPSNYTSLASALRSAATSASHPAEANHSSLPKGRSSTNMAKAISSELDNTSAHQSMVDDAVDQACKFLATSAKELIELTGSRIPDNGSIANGKGRNGSKASKKNECSISWMKVYHDSRMLIVKAKGGKQNKNLVNGIRCDVDTVMASMTNEMPKSFVEAAFKETATILLLLHREEASTKLQKDFQKTIQEATRVLLEVLQTNLISAQTDYGLGLLHRGNIFFSILQACAFLSLGDVGNGNIGKLHVIDAMLEHVRDIPEGALVSILRFVLRNVRVDDAVAYYSSLQEVSKKGTRLSNQYKEMSGNQGDSQKQIGNRLLSEAVLDFTLKVVTYSNCNQSFLTKAMRDSINTSGEVETLLLTLAKLLKVGSTVREDDDDLDNHYNSNQVSLTLGTIHWISALTDAHMGTIMKLTNEGGLVIDRIQRAVRAAMAQLEFANEVREISDLIMSGMPGESTSLVTKSSITQSNAGDTAIVPYSMERLAF